MESLIKLAFLHVEVIGPHVIEGHYDPVSPDCRIIMPQVWEDVIEPDISITMHIWHLPESPPPPASPPPPTGHHISDSANRDRDNHENYGEKEDNSRNDNKAVKKIDVYLPH